MESPLTDSPALPEPNPAAKNAETKQRNIVIIAVIVIILILALLILAVWFLLQPATPTDKIRDIFIIFLSFESLLLGIAMIVLILQMASLINLLQNEVRPILNATSETVNNLRGTAEFLGESVVEPVIKLNGYLAGFQRVIELMRFWKN